MKKKFCSFLIIMLACTGLLSGCAAEMYELTEKEEEVIVQYAAYVLGKHNIFQKDGMVKLEPEELREDEQAAVSEEQETQSEEQEVLQEGQAVASEEQETQSAEVESISLPMAIGQEGTITTQYLGHEFMQAYQEGEYFYLNAESGKFFLVMHFKIQNVTAQDVDINVMKASPNFCCRINGDKIYEGKTTFANKDLSSYLGTLKSEEEQEVVLLFEIEQAESANLTDLELLIDREGTKLAVVM